MIDLRREAKVQPLLVEVEDLTKTFGGVKALDNVSLDFEPGQVTAIIGPNGAGKTTLFNAICGFLQADQGQVALRGIDENGPHPQAQIISGLSPTQIARRGLGVLFRDIRLFGKMTVLDNLLAAYPDQAGEKFWQLPFQGGLVRRQERWARRGPWNTWTRWGWWRRPTNGARICLTASRSWRPSRGC
jgi:branched-chain amino acid transport system ATP-binding protein